MQIVRYSIIFIWCIISGLVYAGNASYSAFNELINQKIHPYVQIKFANNYINTFYVSTTLTGSGTVSASARAAQVASGGASSSTAVLRSRYILPYKPGIGSCAILSAVFGSPAANNVQLIGVGNFNTSVTPTFANLQDGFFFGYNGTTFGIFWYYNSTLPASYTPGTPGGFIPKSSWNGDVMDGTGSSGVTLTTTDGNLYKIQYQWLGFGCIKFYIANPADGSWILVHTIQYPNTDASTSLVNPFMYLWASSSNTTNTSNITVQIMAMSGAIEGAVNHYNDTRNAVWHSGSVSSGSTNNFLTIQNNATFNGLPNMVMVYPDFFVAMATGITSFTELRFQLNSTVTGASFVNVGNNSCVAYDITGTTVSNAGVQNNYLSFYIDANNPFIVVDLRLYGLHLGPSDRLIVQTQGVASTMTLYMGFSWTESF